MSRTRATRVNDCGVVESIVEAHDKLHGPGDFVLVERGVARWLVLACPCGCGDVLPINIDRRAGPAWRIFRTKGRLTVYPSVWRESGCEAHFMVWEGQVLDLSGPWPDTTTDRVDEDDVLRHVGDDPVHYAAIADTLAVDPWSVLFVLRRMVRRGVVREVDEGEFTLHRK